MEKLKKLWNDCINWKGWTTIKNWNLWKILIKKKFWKVVLIAITTICLISGSILIGISFKPIAAFLFTSEDRNGELAKVLLSVFGGIGLFYGLFINSRRIKEQTRQNNISEYSNSDKRFGDAIGYLGSNNTSIVFGGIYALHQLAKEDKRYTEIVALLFVNFLKERSKPESEEILDNMIHYNPIFNDTRTIFIKTVLDLLFNSENTYNGTYFDLSKVLIIDFKFNKNVRDCNFDGSQIFNSHFNGGVDNCSFNNAKLFASSFGARPVQNCSFVGSELEIVQFMTRECINLSFNFSTLTKCYFFSRKIINCSFSHIGKKSKVDFRLTESFTKTKIDLESMKRINFNECKNTDQINYT